MSAQQIAQDVQPRPRLRVVPAAPTAAVSTLGFVGIVLSLLAAGLALVMIVTTSVGAQSKELASLRTTSTQLGYRAAALESNLQRASSANALALRATELGMVPNPYPAFVNLADGTVTGEPTKATGDEMPFLRGIAPSPAEPTVPIITPAPEPPPAVADPALVAAGSTEEQP
ncbi:hypothetical protein [Tessaracoccus flavus]|jgi:hypothetical protein|uniref:Uncharacterized protein n=1 Tax=Tessaracoccus flavus TaxID=1610493 RepID=A0A1Q2CD88_9ACTN|nr:hypothetical protein [Tessaracoccus flavus]AQP44079.1 hypothetical protein RPIT_03995 [Tessaracoccus flavus]SDY34130.1 cell division protein FtsI (penicillin-binding protein 3) [Tessaracoccus flavus]